MLFVLFCYIFFEYLKAQFMVYMGQIIIETPNKVK